jgi:NADPH2:quinone reductase
LSHRRRATKQTKRLTHTGSTLRPRTIDEKAAIAKGIADHVWPLIAAGGIKPAIVSIFPLDRAAAAHACMATSRPIGKIVLTV